MARSGPSKFPLTVTFFEHRHVLLLDFILQVQNSLLITNPGVYCGEQSQPTEEEAAVVR
jgi:hypothetical protein